MKKLEDLSWEELLEETSLNKVKKQIALENLQGNRRPDLGGKSNSSKQQRTKNKLRKYNGHKPTKKVLVYKDDKFIDEYKSLSECSRQMNLDKGNIQKVCKGIYKQYNGYTFRYK